jgi:hypothetical protein
MTVVSRAGYGQPGYCKICASDLASQINRKIKLNDKLVDIRSWSADKGFKFSAPTLTAHVKHITDPKTTFVEAARENPVIRRVTQEEFLRTIVDIGAQKATEDPGSVTINHAIRAASILEAKRDKDQGAINILVLALSRNLPENPEPKLIGES